MGLSACVSTTDPTAPPLITPGMITALPKTVLIPTGVASYQGNYTVTQNTDDSIGTTIDRWTETSTANLTLNANFATRTVTAGLDNLVISGRYDSSVPNSTVQSDSYYTQFSGQSAGSGLITTSGGVVGFNANLTGTFTARFVGTSASDAVVATGDAIFTVNDPISVSGEFRGPNAVALLGVQTLDLGTGSKTTTIVATRPSE